MISGFRLQVSAPLTHKLVLSICFVVIGRKFLAAGCAMNRPNRRKSGIHGNAIIEHKAMPIPQTAVVARILKIL
jgi:hypothetical protein